jgi:hypothetical protein
MKLVEDVITITTVTTREEIAAWVEERRRVLGELVECEGLGQQLRLDERQAA